MRMNTWQTVINQGPERRSLWRTIPRAIIFTALAAAIASCTTGATPQFLVAESFETGADVFVRSLAIDGANLWVATSDGVIKVERATGRKVGHLTTQNGLMVNYAFTVSVDPKGTTWLGTNSGGLARVDGERVTTFHVRDGLADPWVYNIAYQRDGAMWIGTWNGVSRYRDNAFSSYHVEDGLINRWVYAVAVDRDDSVWFGTEGGVSRFDGTTWTSWTHRDGLGAPNTANLEASDNTGFGSFTTGNIHRHDLTALDPEGRETYNENYVFSLLIDPRGVKWIGTWGGGVARFDGKTWKNYTTKDGLAGNVVYAIAQDPTGRLWFGTNHGVSTYDGKTWSTVSPAQRYTAGDVYALAVAPDRSVWIGYKGGVSRISARS
ncbi:MAG: ligand-binding sensor domain-containing protein [Nitrospirota bacterium]